MISFLSYFIVPTVLFLTFIKLNHRYRWIVKAVGRYSEDYTLFNKYDIFAPFFWIYWAILFIAWPIIMPLSVVFVTVYGLCRWATNGKSIIPE